MKFELVCACVYVCVLGGGSLPRGHNKPFVFIMHLAFEKDKKVSLFYFLQLSLMHVHLDFSRNVSFSLIQILKVCIVSVKLYYYCKI